jgi:hypothetical protein
MPSVYPLPGQRSPARNSPPASQNFFASNSSKTWRDKHKAGEGSRRGRALRAAGKNAAV